MSDLDTFSKILIGILIFLMGGLITLVASAHRYNEAPEYFDIYATTTPFGFFSAQGEVSGGLFFFYGSIRGSENYDVKYLQDGILRTVICNAEETDVIIDNTLRLERIENTRVIWFWMWKIEQHRGYDYKIHIPYLPEVDPITEDWIGR